MKCLLDTNAYRDLRVGHPRVAALVSAADELLMSVIVLGELLFGFRHGSRFAQNRVLLSEFLSEPRVRCVHVTQTTADRYALIAASLKRKGRPIPTNDVWIAAHALEHGGDLVSSDEHFSHVDGLSWIKPL